MSCIILTLYPNQLPAGQNTILITLHYPSLLLHHTPYTSHPTTSHCSSPYTSLSSHRSVFFFHLLTSTYTAAPTTTPSTPLTRLSSLGPLFTDPYSSHPILPPAMPLYELGIAFTDPSLPLSHIHTSTQTPSYMRPQTQHLTHTDTMRLRSPQFGVHPLDLFLKNDVIINHTLQILHHHSPYTTTRHYLPTPFLEVIQRPNNDIALPRFYQRFLGLQDGPSLDNSLLLIPINITPTHWTLLVRATGESTIPITMSYNSVPIPLDLTTTQAHLKHYATVLQLTHGLASIPIRHVPAVTQDDENNCGIYVLMTSIIYFYHPTPTTFLCHTLNYPESSD